MNAIANLAAHGGRPSPIPGPVRILRWNFLRDDKILTCEVDMSGNQYDVCLVPHWDVGASMIETFDRSSSALSRHAEIARELRDTGWLLVRDEAPHAA